MKYPRLTTLRQSAEDAPLPAVLTLLLAVALAFQLLLPVDAQLPDVALRPLSAPNVTPIASTQVTIPPALLARNAFAPVGVASAGGGQAAASVALLGVARSGRGGAAVLRGSDGTTLAVPLGGRIGPWRVTGIGAGSARIDDGSRSLILRIGETTQAPAGEGPGQ